MEAFFIEGMIHELQKESPKHQAPLKVAILIALRRDPSTKHPGNATFA
jgi:hypothetical protein